jgi:hypothetical protein
VKGDLEEVVEVDPATELVTAQEIITKKVHTKAKLTWKKHKNGGHFRELLEIDDTRTEEGATMHSSAKVQILDLKVAGAQ